MSTVEENQTQEINQNGSEKLETLNLFENKPPNSVKSEESLEKVNKEDVSSTVPPSENEEEKCKNLEESINDEVNNEEREKTVFGEDKNSVLDKNTDSLVNKENSQISENSDTSEAEMSRPNVKTTRPPNKTTSRSTLPHNNSKLPAELSGQPSLKNAKEDVKYWKNREQELLSKIAELETKVADKDGKLQGPLDPVATQVQEKLESDLVETNKEKENYKNRLQTIEKELFNKQKEISTDSNLKNFKSSDEVINHLKLQNEDLRNALAKMTAILRDKTTLCINQEKKIVALSNQIESLKEVVAITKDLLNIRNMEVHHLSNDISAMESKIDCERQRHNQMLIKMDEAVKLNGELKKEYENQLKLFQHLRDSYEEKILLLSRDNKDDRKDKLLMEERVQDEMSKSQV